LLPKRSLLLPDGYEKSKVQDPSMICDKLASRSTPFPPHRRIQRLPRLEPPPTMNFYKQAALALDHLDTKQGSVKGSVAAAGVAQGNESKRVLAREWVECMTSI
jgi:putative methyltransferase